MRSPSSGVGSGVVALWVAAALGCQGREAPAPSARASPAAAPTTPPARIQPVEANPENVKKAEEALQRAADRDRRHRRYL